MDARPRAVGYAAATLAQQCEPRQSGRRIEFL